MQTFIYPKVSKLKSQRIEEENCIQYPSHYCLCLSLTAQCSLLVESITWGLAFVTLGKCTWPMRQTTKQTQSGWKPKIAYI